MYDQEKLQKLQKAKEKLEPEILSLTNVQGFSIGFKTKEREQTEDISLVIHVYKKIPSNELSMEANVTEIIKRFDSTLLSDVIETTEPILQFQKVPKTLVAVNEDNVRYRPLEGGCKIALEDATHYYYGTGGCIAHSKLMQDHTFILTCEHVVEKSQDDLVYQPSVTVLNKIGKVENKVCNAKVDCASVKLKDTESKATIIEIGSVKGTAAPQLNDIVEKRGKTTGLTCGKISNVSYSGKIAERIVTDQIIISKIDASDPRLSDNGDSGSAWVLKTGHKVVGLHWAGGNAGANAYACLISEVENELGVEIWTE
jgi:hypothetical protein